MLKKIALVCIAGFLVLAGSVVVMYFVNAAPVAPRGVRSVESLEAVRGQAAFPVVSPLPDHRVRVVTNRKGIRDFRDDQTTDASKATAERVGLGRVFEESGSTGVVLVVDGRTKDVTASISGSRDVAEYRAAIDAALNRARE